MSSVELPQFVREQISLHPCAISPEDAVRFPVSTHIKSLDHGAWTDHNQQHQVKRVDG